MIIATLTLLNETTIRCLNETDEKRIISTFTELAVNILGADFGFVWMGKKGEEFKLTYRSNNLPYIPLSPTKGGRNTKVLNSSKPDFVSVVKKRNDKYDVSRYMKSFVIIPITYQDNVYGNVVICFKKLEEFSREKKILCTLVGSNIAQVITILRHRKTLKENEEYRRSMEEEKLRSEFLADAMHEIRTPLAIIKGTVDLSMKNYYATNQSIAFEAINTEIQHLTGILSELSVLTSKDSPVQRKIQTKKIKLSQFLKEISKRWIILANKRDIVIKIGKIPAVSILADEVYLDKLFANIVKNAITYGKDGGHISISGTIEKDMVKINIQDDGVGISRKDLGRIFDRFYRADKARSNFNSYNGTGLGLAITKWIAESHGGKVTVESTLGKGSTFSVFLPVVKISS